jgi:hypothetical protein
MFDGRLPKRKGRCPSLTQIRFNRLEFVAHVATDPGAGHHHFAAWVSHWSVIPPLLKPWIE